MPIFGTIDVYHELARILNESDDWARVGAELNYRLAFRYGAPIDKTFAIAFDHGRITDVSELTEAVADDLDYVISASPKTSRRLLEGKKNPLVAMTTGKVKIDGDVGGLLTHMAAFSRVLDAMAEVDLT